MNQISIVSEITIRKSYFRGPITKAFALLLMGGAVSFSHAQSARVSEDQSGLAKLSTHALVQPAASSGYSLNKAAKAVALSGNYTVGTSGDYQTLTAAVADFNSAAITGPVSFTLTDAAYTAETFPIVIEANAGSSATNTLTIKPAAGVTPVISGDAPLLLKINGADYVTIDGSNNGSNSTDLTLNGTASTSSPVIVWVASTSTYGSDYVTLKNTKILGLNPSATIAGVLVSGPTLGSAGTNPNNYVTIENNVFNRAQNAIFAVGLSTNQDDGMIVRNNTIGSSTAGEGMGFRGVAVQNAKNVLIANNKISGITTSTTSTSSGILIGVALNNVVVTANQIDDVSNTNTTGYGSNGIYSNAVASSSNVLISNNFVSNVRSVGYALGGVADNGSGIVIGNTGTGIKVYNNTVVLNTNQTNVGKPAALNILSTVTGAGALDVQDNIFVNNQTNSGPRYAIYSGAAKTVFATIDYNNYSTTGPNLAYITSDKATLADVQSGFGGNTHSLNVNPVFVSTTDLHLTNVNAALDGKGTPLADVTVDIDGTPRSATAPDMGADEFRAALGGVYTVGATGQYASLTNPGGAFEDLNASGAYSNVTFNIVSDLTAEDGSVAINEVVGGYSVTIKPSGEARTISGTKASTALIRTDGASNVTIDGSLSGGTDKSLSITNLSTTGPQVVRFTSGAAAISNNTLKNTIITNGANTSSAVVVNKNDGTAGLFNNITIENNTVKKAYMGIFANAVIGAGNGTITVKGNDLSTSGADAITLGGVYVQGADGASVQGNTIGNFLSTTEYQKRGIWLATGTVNTTISGNTLSGIGFSGATSSIPVSAIYVTSGNTGVSPNSNNVIDGNIISGISSTSSSVTSAIHIGGTSTAPTSGVAITKNKITNVKNSNSGGYAAVGIYLNGYSTVANGGANIVNNFISDVANYGYNGTSYLDNGVGITFNGASSGYKIYNNTVNMATNQTTSTGMSAAINVHSSITAAGAIDLRNNIFVNSQTTSKRYAIYSSAASTVFSNIDYNNYYSTENVGYLGSARATLANWQTATGKDAHSLNVNPVFASPTDLHLTDANTALDGKGTPIAEVLIDIDGDTRSTTAPDMGADEFTATTAATNESAKQEIRLYPNPVVDYVTIKSSTKVDAVDVYNVSGQKVSSTSLSAGTGSVDMRSLTSGVYIISVKSGKDVHTVKVIKK